MLLSLWITILLCQLCLGLDCWVCHLNLRGSPNTCYDNHMGILEKCNYTKPLCVMKAKKKLFYKSTYWRYCTERKEHHVFNCRDEPGGDWTRSKVSSLDLFSYSIPPTLKVAFKIVKSSNINHQ